MKTRRVLVLTFLGLVSMAVAGVRVALDKVPADAVKAIKARFPKAEIRFVDKEGGDKYEFAMKEGDRMYDVGVSAAGKVLNIKEELAEAKLPEAVAKGIQKQFPGAKFVECEKVTTGDGKGAKTTFEVVLKTDKGKVPAKFDATGKHLGKGD